MIYLSFFAWIEDNPSILEHTLGVDSSTSEPKIDTFEVEDQSLEENMVEDPCQNRDRILFQVVRRMKQIEHFNPSKRQTYTRILGTIVDNVSFRIDPHLL